jgi:hypothetical protein
MLMNECADVGGGGGASRLLKMQRAQGIDGYEFSVPWTSGHPGLSAAAAPPQLPLRFELAEPRLWAHADAARHSAGPSAHKHAVVVVVEQAPFSALKSIRAQEQASKVSTFPL